MTDILERDDAAGPDEPSVPRRWRGLRASLARLSMRPRSMLLLAAVPLLAIAAGIAGWLFNWHLGVDSAVYRAGALTLLHGQPLYDSLTLSTEPYWALLPFTYPPTAAVAFIPLAVFPVQVAWGLLAAVSILAMALVIRVSIATLPVAAAQLPRWASPARATLVFSVLLLGLEPVWRTLFLGQINLILLAMVVLDVLVVSARGSRWGGVLVGVAAAIKLTPLIFVPHLLFTGRVREALRALGTFFGLQAAMFVIVPQDALRYWTDAVSNPGRTGPMHWAGNQSINGLINRITDLAPWSLTAAIIVAAVLAPAAVWLMLRCHRRGQPLAALLVTAFYGLLISPVSWTHHWVWAVPLIVLLVSRLPQTSPATAWKRWAGAGAVLAVFISCVLLILPNGRNVELHWQFWEFVFGSAYILVPVGLALVLAVRRLKLIRAAGRADPRRLLESK